jgi:hypothetical protein
MLPDVHIFFTGLRGVGGFSQSSPMILATARGKIFGEYLLEKKTQVLKLQIRFHVSMF